MKLVGRVSRALVDADGRVRVDYPPFDVLVARVGTDYVAMEDACNHAGASLYEGSMIAGTVACPLHGYMFSLKNGRGLNCRGYNARLHAVRVVDGIVREAKVVLGHVAPTPWVSQAAADAIIDLKGL